MGDWYIEHADAGRKGPIPDLMWEEASPDTNSGVGVGSSDGP